MLKYILNFSFIKYACIISIGDVLTRDIIFYLANLGPNVTNLTDCAVQQRKSFVPKPNASQYLTSLVSLSIYTGMETPSLEALQVKFTN